MFVGYIQNNSQAGYADQYQMLNSLVKERRVKKECVHIRDDFENLKNVILKRLDAAILKSEMSKKFTLIKTTIYALVQRRGISFHQGDE